MTGARGLVGSRLVPRLQTQGHDLVATDLELDVSDPLRVAGAVAEHRPDAVVHLAALSSPAQSVRAPQATYRVNFVGSRAILAAVRERAPQARVLLVGSGDIYGTAQPGAPAFAEGDALRPRSPYARSKAAADQLGAFYAKRGLDVIRIRAFNHTGPGQSDLVAASSFARQLAEIEYSRSAPVLRVGNLDAVRDFLDVDDVVEAYLRLLDPGVPAGAYNVASGRGVRIGDLLNELVGISSAEPTLEVDPERFRPTDCCVGNAERLGAIAGWEPQIPLATTLERLLNDWRARLAAA